jgi:uncharacterized HAD superfamily protein
MKNSDFLKVINEPDLIREKDSKAILNTNTKELNKYKEEREKQLKLKSIAVEHDLMKTDIAEIKSLLRELLGKK